MRVYRYTYPPGSELLQLTRAFQWVVQDHEFQNSVATFELYEKADGLDMSYSERKRSLTSEVADETTKKNSFEERRLRRRLVDIEQHALKQKKKRNDEQLEYALENLSLEGMDTFNSLTRKILQSNFLPPISRKPRGSNNEEQLASKDDLLVERLRGSKMINKYLKNQKSRKLTRSLSIDSGLIPDAMNEKKEVQTKPGPYSAFLFKRRVVESVSLPTCRPLTTADGRRFDKATRRTHFVDSKNKNSKSHSKRAAQKIAFPRQVGPQRKIQHSCLSEAIEYKLKMRELERKSLQESS